MRLPRSVPSMVAAAVLTALAIVLVVLLVREYMRPYAGIQWSVLAAAGAGVTGAFAAGFIFWVLIVISLLMHPLTF